MQNTTKTNRRWPMQIFDSQLAAAKEAMRKAERAEEEQAHNIDAV